MSTKKTVKKKPANPSANPPVVKQSKIFIVDDHPIFREGLAAVEGGALQHPLAEGVDGADSQFVEGTKTVVEPFDHPGTSTTRAFAERDQGLRRRGRA